MYIQTEETPNPNALKFFPGIAVVDGEPRHYFAKDEAYESSLAVNLFAINGVRGIFLGNDFITITKDEIADWDLIKPEILMTMMDHFVSGMPVLDNDESSQINSGSTEIDYDNLGEIEKQIVELIETRVRPSVAMDGGDIIYKSFENGVVTLKLHGACSGCPSSTVTLKQGIESMLKYYVPEVESVEAEL